MEPKRLEQARLEGVVTNLTGVIEGAAGVAALVFNKNGTAVAALNLAGPRHRFDVALDEIVAAAKKTAERLSSELAGMGERDSS